MYSLLCDFFYIVYIFHGFLFLEWLVFTYSGCRLLIVWRMLIPLLYFSFFTQFLTCYSILLAMAEKHSRFENELVLVFWLLFFFLIKVPWSCIYCYSIPLYFIDQFSLSFHCSSGLLLYDIFLSTIVFRLLHFGPWLIL